METLEHKIKVFLSDGYGDGDGDGSGYGDGSGSGYGYGDGSGSGSGDGYGYGYGSGDGDGDGYGYGDGSGSGYGYGSGSASGSGDGYGYGYGSGYGSGSGYGYGDGSGSGSGSGYGDGSGINTFNKDTVYIIDDVQTIIRSIKGNIAKGFILKKDLTLEPCFIVKENDLFAHGATLKDAIKALEDKLFDYMPVEERIEKFKAQFKNGVKYPAKLFFEWHHKLTGSCKIGREIFCQERGINVASDEFTVSEFIGLTKDSYRGDIIKELIGHFKS